LTITDLPEVLRLPQLNAPPPPKKKGKERKPIGGTSVYRIGIGIRYLQGMNQKHRAFVNFETRVLNQGK